MPLRGPARFEQQNNSTSQVPRLGLVRFEDEQRKRHCTYCRKYHRGPCAAKAKIATASKLDPFAFEFDASSDEPHWTSDEPTISSSVDSESSFDETPPEFQHAVKSAVDVLVAWDQDACLEPIPEAHKIVPPPAFPLDSDMNSIETAVHETSRTRNLAIIAHVDHGKTTIADRLLAKASMLRDQGVAKSCKMDTGKLEIERGITIKATSTGLLYPAEQLLVNLVDCPGHVDFNGEVSAALRITDGALLVVDCIEGVCVQTEMVLRQALEEGVKPILFLNKLDRAFTELQLAPEQAYFRLISTIEAVNSIVREYNADELCPTKNNVIFGSGLFGWAFTLSSMAAARGLSCSASKLWGDRYIEKSTGAFVKLAPSPDADRTFSQCVLQPLYRLHAIAADGDETQLAAFAKRHKIDCPPSQPRLKDSVRLLLRNWLPCGDVIVNTVAEHLPCPSTAQQARAPNLGAGLEGTPAYDCIQACDPSGPLIVYVTKLAPMGKNEGKKLIALGRVFSGTVRAGDRVTVIDAQHGQQHTAKIDRVKMMMVDKMLDLTAAPAGSLIGLVGVHHVGTVLQDPSLPPMRGLSLSVSPVVSMAVRPQKAADTQRLVEKLRELVKIDTSLALEHDAETGEHCLIGTGELHMQSALHDLQDMLPAGVLIRPSEPSVRCRETILSAGQVCLAKSGNKHNRIFARAVPLSVEVEELLDSGELTQSTDDKTRSDLLSQCGWDRSEARRKVLRITGSNVLVDCTEGLSMQDILEHLANAFDSVVTSGVLCNSPVVGVRLEIHDGTRWHKERTHRGPNQMVEPARRAFLAALLTAEPRLREPILQCKVQVPETQAQKVCAVLKKRRGVITGYDTERLATVEAHVPVDESFGLSEELRKETSGYASPQCAFSKWQEIRGDPRQPDNLAAVMMNKTRERKRLPEAMPMLSELADKM